MLEQRKEAAAQILSEPLDEYKAEERLVLQLEEEVERLRRKLPNAVSPDAEKTIENMMQELEELENQNEADNESVRQRQSNIEREMSIVNKGLQEIEKMESEEEILQEQLRKDQEKLARTPKINVAELEDLERLRKELEERKKNVSQKNKEFVETTKDAENSLNELRETVSKLQIEYQELNQQKLQIEKTKSELQMIKDGQSKNFNGVTDFDNEIAELNRKLENQQAELAKMNAKKANLDRRFNDAEKTKKKLLDKEAALKLRRDKIDETKGIYESLRDELETKKKAIIELEIHVKEMEKKTREMMDKVNEKQDEIGQKSIMVTEAPSSSQFSELQKILSESDAGGMVSSHESS
ncbi:hypothetical protein TRFO_29375 [Tritrichomonas foetus]|uniref:Uncharacterized protein n=1 Tax=Tritrichomonas foetus TaxID=1144522 RepID=A0A1J4JWB3_9EUKA|nr:hypothetical protein TRFO_29375 [Tritrichomonas foetus]|eukprot:OHT03283.1 hypothetical protein TRFO_29375 [Tritrichomonas foetus]